MTGPGAGFEPIAIVGRGCVLPMALSPEQFWDNIATGRVGLDAVRPEDWRLPPTGFGDDRRPGGGRAAVAGLVRGFAEVFDPEGFATDAGQVAAYDPALQWVLHAGRAALREAGDHAPPARTGLILGNLGYPSRSLAAYAERVWLADHPDLLKALPEVPGAADPRARFCSGLWAHAAANALGLGGASLALDAACASALYAIKIACDRLHDGTADVMLAGAVSGCDGLIIDSGFEALGALSPSGQSRPFQRAADGLVPAEGAALLALMRLRDAVAARVPVLGVVRGIGLSNDGRTGGFLAPAEDGQIRAMRAAYEQAGFGPDTVELLECHATGTPLGDAVEARSTARFFGARPEPLPIGSAKSNVGHLLTASGAAGLLKLLAAIGEGTLPATADVADPIADVCDGPLRLLTANEPWSGPRRRAAISAFGFGGNNAHLVVEAFDGVPGSFSVAVPAHPAPAEIAIVALGARVGGMGVDALRDALLSGHAPDRAGPDIEVALDGVRYPPRDLGETLGQQVLVLEAAREAARKVVLPPERTAVLVGMGCDPETARVHARRRLDAWLPGGYAGLGAGDGFSPPLTAARVLGAMANIAANRIGGQLGLAGPGFAVCAEEASGIVALKLAVRALRAGEIDAALVGAVDLSDEPVHRAAVTELGLTTDPADAAVVVVLKRLRDARRDGDPVIALIDPEPRGSAPPTPPAGLADLVPGDLVPADIVPADLVPAELFGAPHAARGLLTVAATALALHHRARPLAGRRAQPRLAATTADVVTSVLGAAPARVRLRAADAAPWAPGRVPRLHVYSGANRSEALAAATFGIESDTGPARLAVLARDPAHLADQVAGARAWLDGDGLRPPGVAFRDRPIDGETAFVYTKGSAFYPTMGSDLALAFAPLANGMDDAALVSWVYEGRDTPNDSLDQILAVGFIARLHTRISREVLGIEPQAAIGYSSGESAALVALGVWTDVAAMSAEARASGLFTHDLGGELRAVRRYWARHGIAGERWAGYILSADPQRVRAMGAGERAVHLTAVCAPGTCVVAGEERACAAFVQRFDAASHIRINYDLVAHAPELVDVRDRWHALHRRPTTSVPGVRFYRGATGDWYHPTEQTAADAITEQMLSPVDFPNVIERAWQDGVRVFVEHGPAAQCTNWIRRILGDREHVAVALDTGPDQGLWSLSAAVAELVAAGVAVRHDALAAYLASHDSAPSGGGATIRLPKRLPAPTLEHTASAYTKMEPAPELIPMPIAGHRPVPGRPAPPPPQPEPASALSAASAWRASIAAAHHLYLDVQASAHARFLAGRASAMTRIAAAPSQRQPAGAPSQRLPAATRAAAALPHPVAPAGVAAPAAAPATTGRAGPRFDRAQLEHLASGRISDLFGPMFAVQDADRRQTRMPGPPLLLADRVVGIDAAPGSLATGTIWTETDVRADAWYLDPVGRMPAGLVVEAGQADLLLISWLGADLRNRGERVYRLLGSDVTFHAPPPGPGQTLRFEIRVVGHVVHGPVRLFFFEYDCYCGDTLLLTVRDGQAGFFNDEELAGTGGVIWDASAVEPPPLASRDAPAVRCTRSAFDSDALDALGRGRPDVCFGAGWEAARAHVRTPRIGSGRLRLLDEVPVFDPAGGPWGRGYLRAEAVVGPDDWFFDGHFLNDPCMPGTLMSEGCFQAVAFYLIACGYTISRDGWRFEPVPGRTARMRCRGQVTPDSKRLTYEVFVTEVADGPLPTVIADVLVTVDGVKALHVAQCAVRLVPDWPLDHWRHLGPPAVQPTAQPIALRELGGLDGHRDRAPVAEVAGLPLGYASLLACAWGKPTDGLGPMAEAFVGTRRGPRLPGPPYHFMSRITAVEGPYQGMAVGSAVTAEYDVPDEAWYFTDNAAPTMPAAALMEVALQPCGWLGCYVGSPVQIDAELLFRNLDGDVRVLREVRPDNRIVSTRAELTDVSRAAGMIIETFRIECHADGEPLLRGSAVFGYFLTAAFAQQPGLPPSPAERERVNEPCDNAPALYHPDAARRSRQAGPMLMMLDRITGYWPRGGAAGLGRLRAEKDVDPGEWFFKAHFFQDPVMPGSLGVEALCQLLQWYMADRGIGDDLPGARFEPVALDAPLKWTYRGQVVPTDRLITVELEILEVRDRTVFATAWLWVDGRRIYRVERLGARMVADPD